MRRLRPDDPEALKHLGLIAFYSSDNGTARRLLTRYLATGVDDYKADYALGEVINKFADWRKATPYFKRALAKIEKLKAPTVDDLKMKAQLLHRNGRFGAAIKTYERLLRLRTPPGENIRDPEEPDPDR